MNLSINPSYFCNFRCNWCYLTPEQLSDKTLLNLETLGNLLSQFNNINHVDLYGGEVGLLPADYAIKLLNCIREKNPSLINITTNLSVVPAWFFDDDINVAVSFDFESREKHSIVLRNMLTFTKPLHVIILAQPHVISKDVTEMIAILNSINNVVSVEIKPYSTNQSNQHNVSHKDYERFVQEWISSPIEKNFTFQNEVNIKKSITKAYNAFSNEHLYITPTGKFAVLEFDLNDHEYFLEFDNLDFYQDWCAREHNKVYNSPICNKCNYIGHCLTEHYRSVLDLENSCNGYINLINWYTDGRLES